MVRVDASSAMGALDKMDKEIERAVNRGLRNIARDAAMLSRARAPHNMDRKKIRWGLGRLGPYVKASGATAAYDGEGVFKPTFKHPVFATKGTPPGTWKGNWATQATKPFIEKAVAEVMVDAELILSAEVQEAIDQAVA